MGMLIAYTFPQVIHPFKIFTFPMPLFYFPNAYTFLQVFPLLYFFFTNLLTKLFLRVLLSLTHGNSHDYFSFGQKIMKSITSSPCSGCSFLSFFLLFVKKISQKAEALSAKKHFSLETDRNVPKLRSFMLEKSQKMV